MICQSLEQWVDQRTHGLQTGVLWSLPTTRKGTYTWLSIVACVFTLGLCIRNMCFLFFSNTFGNKLGIWVTRSIMFWVGCSAILAYSTMFLKLLYGSRLDCIIHEGHTKGRIVGTHGEEEFKLNSGYEVDNHCHYTQQKDSGSALTLQIIFTWKNIGLLCWSFST